MNKDFRKILDSLKEAKEEPRHRNGHVLLVDSLNTFLRSFVTVHHLNPQGNHIGGLTGFLKSVGNAIRLIDPTRVILVFDGHGGYHTAAIKTDGTLWTWGINGYGPLGDNTISQRNTPVTTFAGGTNWKQVDCGFSHTAAIKTDGTLWIWGRGTNGRLGDNTTTNKRTPVTTFAGGTNWKQVSGGFTHTTAIKTDGTLWTWGFNSYGQLGDNTTTQRNTPVTTFAGGTNWKQVSGGYLYTAATTYIGGLS